MSWQSLENAFYMSSFLAAKAVPVVAAGASVVFAVSPWCVSGIASRDLPATFCVHCGAELWTSLNRQTVSTIRQAKSTLQFSFAPFFFYFVSSVIYTLYAFVTANTVMGATALLGALFGSYYVYVYYTHAGDKVRTSRAL